jgi:hypothetical protein
MTKVIGDQSYPVGRKYYGYSADVQSLSAI